MQVLLESIRVEMPDFHMPLLSRHLQRIQKTLRELWNEVHIPEIENAIRESFTTLQKTDAKYGVYKCRLLYDRQGIQAIEWHPYREKQLVSLTLKDADHISYTYKYADRTAIEQLKASAHTDDILMCKNGLITDISYANVAFFNGRHWLTPSHPLLEGVKRADLLSRYTLKEAEIAADEISFFHKIRLFNALIDQEYNFDFDKSSGVLMLQKAFDSNPVTKQ